MLCLLAISLTMALYAPIRALYSKVTHQEKASFRENELLSISNSFESTAKEAAVLEDRVMNLSSIARNQFLVRLLNGCYTDAEEICRLCAQYDLRYDAPLFFVIFAAPFPHAIERRNLPAAVENCLKNLPVSVTSVEIWQENTFCFILNTNDASARIVAADALQNMYSNAENIFLRFGVGGVYGEISEIADSFVEAAIAARLSIHKNVSLYERRLVPDGNKGEHLDEAFSFLKEALQRGEETVANRVVAEIISSLSDLSDSFLIFRFHTAKIISLLQEQFRREEIPFSREYLESLLDYHSNTEFSQKVTEAIAFLCRAVKERMENQDRQTRKCLLEYIKANFTRYDFSMDDVLARFDISQTYAMSILQQATNMTFAKYIAFLRMEEFKRLLIQTDRNVGDCVKAVGYNDAPSFMRKFKLQEGVTPSQFRAQHWR